MPRHLPRRPARRTVRYAVGLLAAASLAFGPALDGIRDGKATVGIDLERQHELQALATATAPLGPLDCIAGFAGPYPCENIDLLSIVTIPELGQGTGSDVWGWTDPETGAEIAITTTTAGAAFVDVTEPTEPVVLGRLRLLQTGSTSTIWRDVKVHDNTAYFVSEHGGTNLVTFDLERLRDLPAADPLADELVEGDWLEPDHVNDTIGNAHNVWVFAERDLVIAVGAGTCNAGLQFFDASDRLAPVDAGCFSEDGYTHDVQCVVYAGPDERFQGHDLCFASNEDTLTIVDITDLANPVMLNRIAYDSEAYTHQGDITPDHRWFLFGDELDEAVGQDTNLPHGTDRTPRVATTTYIVNIEDILEAGDVKAYNHRTNAIDHNLYIHDGYVWQANYTAGVRVFDYTEESLEAGELREVAHFDVDPGPDAPVFAGAWTTYPYFESGTILVNSFDSGLFVLRPDLEERTPETPCCASDTPADGTASESGDEPTDDEGPADDSADDDMVTEPAAPSDAQLPATGGGQVLLATSALGAAAALRRRR